MELLCDASETDFDERVVARSHRAPVLVNIGAIRRHAAVSTTA